MSSKWFVVSAVGWLLGLGCHDREKTASVSLEVSRVLVSKKTDRRVTFVLSRPVRSPQLRIPNPRFHLPNRQSSAPEYKRISPAQHHGRFVTYELPAGIPTGTTRMVLETESPGPRRALSTSVDVPLDNTAPVTTVTAPPGKYDKPVSFHFVCSEPATIYHRVDGTAPTQQDQGLACNGTTDPITVATSFTLQYFGVDMFGNSEPIHGASYTISESFFDVPATMEVTADTSSFRFTFTGTELAKKGVLYATGKTQCAALERAAKAKVPPPPGIPMRHEGFTDFPLSIRSVYSGAVEEEVCFGLVVQPRKPEQPLDDTTQEPQPGTPRGHFTNYPLTSMPVVSFVRLEHVTAPPFQTDLERFQRGLYWLASQPPQATGGAAAKAYQLSQPLWPLRDPRDVRRRSRILVNNAARRLEHRIRTERIGDVNEMAERILALLDTQRTPTEDIVQFLHAADYQDDTLTGWGITRGHHADILHTALGILASEKAFPDLVSPAYAFFARAEFLTEEGYSWVAHQPRDMGVSALAYHVLEAPAERYQWILQAIDQGNFSSPRSTAMVLRFMAHWLPSGPTLDGSVSTLAAAKNELVQHQSSDGSWNQDPELTAQALIGLGQFLCIQSQAKQGNRCEDLGKNNE